MRKKDKIDWYTEDIIDKYFEPLVDSGQYDLNDMYDFERFMRVVLLGREKGEW